MFDKAANQMAIIVENFENVTLGNNSSGKKKQTSNHLKKKNLVFPVSPVSIKGREHDQKPKRTSVGMCTETSRHKCRPSPK